MEKNIALAKKYKWYIAAAVVAAIVYWKKDALMEWWNGLGKETPPPPPPKPDPTTSTSQPTRTVISTQPETVEPPTNDKVDNYLLLKKDINAPASVKALQQALNSEKQYLTAYGDPMQQNEYVRIRNLDVDGFFGENVENLLYKMTGLRQITLSALKDKLQSVQAQTTLQNQIATWFS